MKSFTTLAQTKGWVVICVIGFFLGLHTKISTQALEYNYQSISDSVATDYIPLRQRIVSMVASHNLRSTRYGIIVHSLDRGHTIYAHETEQQLVPASLTKLYYSAAAAATLGADYLVRTVIATNGYVRDGILEGNLYLVGHGDCLLTVNDIEQLADKVRALGIHRIRGSIIADASYFDTITNRQQYSGDSERMENLPPITALGLEGNKFTVVVTRGVANRVRFHVLPSSDAVIVGSTKLQGRQYRLIRRRHDSRRRQDKHSKGRHFIRIQPIRLSYYEGDNGIQVIQVSGMPRPNSSISFTIPMYNPPLVAAGVLMRCLQANGITIDGGITNGIAPISIRELCAFDRPLKAFLDRCNKNSDNFVAEHVMKILGATNGKNQHCLPSASERILALLDSLGTPKTCCTFRDGSGLSRQNRITVSSLLTLLRYCAQQRWGETFFHTLAVAGYDGTLKNRMKNSPAAGNFFAKTGTHRNVSGIGGIVRSLSGERFIVISVWNGNSISLYKHIEDQLLDIVASFTPDAVASPTTDQLGPR